MLSRPFDLTPLRLCWLVLALLGAALALWQGDLPWAGTRATEIVAQIALALWCLTETMVRRNWAALWTLPALALGIGCALPLYLFIRSRRIT
ncbi:Protein of unknown function [Paracoccus halophilus]|uniref:DUF2834 domain-containing protein n=1 Tax=Paracoccus halophilus TaxID=376733 RepID=A0A099EZK9_9RHOB|nr:DUF2834 domain-containing protein [Paracoccus halophilus]KGJ03880.1 hypothetical protein IT41_12270 [Paracoccus halophilus]SFA56389.1 Protein of unknown function [Paracoccus halophilus]